MAAKHDASTIFLLTNTKIYLAMLRLVNEMAAGAPGAPRTYGDARRRLLAVYPTVTEKELAQYDALLRQYFDDAAARADEQAQARRRAAASRKDRDAKAPAPHPKFAARPASTAPLALPVDAPVPVRATRAELAFLRGMLADEAYAFLLPAALRTKLRARLACATDDGTKPANDSATDGTAAANGSAGATAAADVAAFFRTNALHLDDAKKEPLRTRLEQLWTALTHQKKIAYRYRAADGATYHGTAAPVRLQYDCALGSYSLIVWHAPTDGTPPRAVKLTVRRLQHLRVTGEPFDAAALREAFARFLAAHATEARLTLRDLPQKNALVRFFSRFERYDKTAERQPDGTYDVRLTYYDFDEADVLAAILSLGPCLIVEESDTLRTAVIERLRAALARQSALLRRSDISS